MAGDWTPPGPPAAPPPDQPPGYGPPGSGQPAYQVGYGAPGPSPYAGGPMPAPVPPRPDVADEPLDYHLVHRGGARGWWRPLVGILVGVVALVVVVPLIFLVLFMIGFALTGQDAFARGQALGDVENPTPMMLAYLNVTLAAAIPVAWALSRIFHGLKPRWLASVRPRIRWGYFGICLALSVLALIATLGVGAFLPGSGTAGGEDAGQLNAFTSTTRDYLLVIALLTPLQAAGEEYFFRGYLTQAVGGLFGRLAPLVSRSAAVLIPALLFALAHGLGQSVPVFVDRLAFGIVAGILVIRTGGLEAGIAMHVLNNFMAFGFTLAFGDMAEALNPPAGSWWDIIPTLTQSLVYLGLASWAARWMNVATRTDPAVLAASRGLVYRFPPAQPPMPAP